MRRWVILAALGCALAAAASAHAAPGDLDPTFGEFGQVVMEDAGYSESTASDLLIEPRGKILVTGFTRNGATVFRFRRNGAVDRSFGDAGQRSIDLGYVFDEQEIPVARQPDGKLVIGLEYDSGPPRLALIRLRRDGDLDPTFGRGGIVKSGVKLGQFRWAIDVDLTGSGRIVVAGPTPGSSPSGPGAGFRVARFLPDGGIDESFGGNGVVDVPGAEYSFATQVLALGRGSVAVGGEIDQTPTVMMLDRSGDLDRRFGGEGRTRAGGMFLEDLDLDAHRRILAAGGFNGGEFVARLTPRGVPDSSFSGDGTFQFQPPPYGHLGALDTGPDGRIAVAGVRDNSAAVTYLRSSGEVAASFGNGGTALTSYGDQYAEATAVEIQRDGKVVTAGETSKCEFRSCSYRLTLTRYLVDAGRRDRDGDGFGDGHDDCPDAAAESRRGCPLVDRKVSLVRHAGVFEGRVRSDEAACVRASEVRVMLARRGRDRLVGASSPSHHGEYAIESDRRAGRFYAELPARRLGRVGICAPGRSRMLNR
jgi:uncharacterized delta-60 repeat protein